MIDRYNLHNLGSLAFFLLPPAGSTSTLLDSCPLPDHMFLMVVGTLQARYTFRNGLRWRL